MYMIVVTYTRPKIWIIICEVMRNVLTGPVSGHCNPFNLCNCLLIYHLSCVYNNNLLYLQIYSGHASEVFSVLSVKGPSHDDPSDTINGSYFVSAAVGERLINAW